MLSNYIPITNDFLVNGIPMFPGVLKIQKRNILFVSRLSKLYPIFLSDGCFVFHKQSEMQSVNQS